MALPYPTKVVLPFDIATAQDMNERHANDVALAAGTGFNNGAITTAAIADGAVTADKIDFTTFGTVDANGWTDYGTHFVKTIAFSGTGNIAAGSTIASNFASNFGVPVNGATPTTSNTTLEKILTTNTSFSDRIVMQRGVSVFSVAWLNAGTSTGQVGNVDIIAVVYGRA